MSYIRSSALGGDGIMFERLSFLKEFAFVRAALQAEKFTAETQTAAHSEDGPWTTSGQRQSLGVTTNTGQVTIREGRSAQIRSKYLQQHPGEPAV